jgi:hypothetical protein
MSTKGFNPRSSRYRTKTYDSTTGDRTPDQEWTDSDQRVVEKAMFDIGEQLSAAGQVLIGGNPSYGRIVDMELGIGDDIKSSCLIAIRLDEDCPEQVRAALAQLIAIMNQQRDRASQAQEEKL